MNVMNECLLSVWHLECLYMSMEETTKLPNTHLVPEC